MFAAGYSSHGPEVYCTATSITIGNVVIPFAATVRDLGVCLVRSLSLKEHISNVCCKSYTSLRLISRVRKALPQSHYAMLANSLVLSHLEFCSTIFLNLPQCSLGQLQQIINTTFRSVHRLKKHDSISKQMKDRRRLTIDQRTELRVADIVFKATRYSATA